MRVPRGSHGVATLLSTILCQGIQCAPATTPLPSRPIYSLPPLPPSLPLNASDNGNCASTARYPSWTSDDWVVEDCYAAVQQLYLTEFLAHPDVAYNFVAPGVSPKGSLLDSQRTPRKYVVRSCVITIMMLDWFHPGQLPAATKFNTALTDVSTYRDIWNAAKSIETACTVSKSPGWLMIGKKSAMGVFVWATDSHINEITGGFPVDSLDLLDPDGIALDAMQTG